MLNFLQRLYVWWTLPAYQPARSLVCNDSGAEHIRVNLTVAVNAAQIRIETHNGRKHLVLPSYTLPDDVVMNGGLYPHSEIEKSYKSLENTFAPLGHPVLDGTYIPASTPEAINAHHIGAFNRNVERRGNRVYVEKWVDVAYAQNTEGGRALLDRVKYDAETETLKGDPGPVHTSTGIFMNRDIQANGKGYAWTARDMVMDHDAILLNEVGAATPEQGVGLLVNSRVEEALRLDANAEVLSADSYSNRMRALEQAAKAKWGQGTDMYAWVSDFDATTAIVVRSGGDDMAVDYSYKNGAVTFADDGRPVTQKTDWVDKNPVVNRILQLIGLKVNSEPVSTPPTAEGETEMTPEELAAALTANRTETLAAVKALLDPVAASVTQLQANHTALADTLTANSRAAEADKRTKVAEVIGEEAAKSLTGNALDTAYAKLVGAAPIVPGFTGNAADGYQTTKLPE